MLVCDLFHNVHNFYLIMITEVNLSWLQSYVGYGLKMESQMYVPDISKVAVLNK